jgi:hypothetical protein
LGDAHGDTAFSYSSVQIPDGPNTGWIYLNQPFRDLALIVHINQQAFTPGSLWYNLQQGGVYTAPNGTIAAEPYCDASHIPLLRHRTREHEGLGSSPGVDSHADAIRWYLGNHTPQAAFEEMVFAPSVVGYTFRQSFRAKHTELWHVLSATSQHKPGGRTDRPVFPCYARPWN